MVEQEPDMMARLATYYQRRGEQRGERVKATLSAMTPREQALVREAAVMGYVRGQQAERAGARETPPDVLILGEVIACCHDMADLYPTINALTEPEASRG